MAMATGWAHTHTQCVCVCVCLCATGENDITRSGPVGRDTALNFIGSKYRDLGVLGYIYAAVGLLGAVVVKWILVYAGRAIKGRGCYLWKIMEEQKLV